MSFSQRVLAFSKHEIFLLFWFSSPIFIDICCWSNMSGCQCWCTLFGIFSNRRGHFLFVDFQIQPLRSWAIERGRLWSIRDGNYHGSVELLTGHLRRLILKELEATILGGKSPIDAAGSHWWLHCRLLWPHVPWTSHPHCLMTGHLWREICARIMSPILCIIQVKNKEMFSPLKLWKATRVRVWRVRPPLQRFWHVRWSPNAG